MAGAGNPGSSLWSYTHCTQYERPKAAVLQSVCTHAPLRSIASAPKVAPLQPGQQQVPPAAAPCTTLEEPTARVQQQQQHLLELLMHAPDAVRPRDARQHLDSSTSHVQQQQRPRQHTQRPRLQQRQQRNRKQQQFEQPPPLLVQQLIAAGASRLPLPPAQLQQWLTQLLPLLPLLPPGQLSHTVHAVSVLPEGPAAAAIVPGWLDSMLAAAAGHFAAGHMDQWAASVLLQAMVKLGLRPCGAWLQAACAGMPVCSWSSGRALSTAAACLPQLGHVPDSSWAAEYFAATADKLQDMPAVGLARMLHGVVAWRQLEQQAQQHQQQTQEQEQLLLPDEWLCSVLQQLHACSSELAPCEVSMTLQALGRLQQPGFLPSTGSNCPTSSDSSSIEQGSEQQASPLRQQCAQQLLHALVPAVARQRHQFGPQDFAVVLHSLALQQQQQQQGLRAPAAGAVLCAQEWLQQVLPAVQACLLEASPRTQATLLWAMAVLMQPHLRQQAAQQQHRQQLAQQRQAMQQQQLLQQLAHPAEQYAAASAPAAATAASTTTSAAQPHRRGGAPLVRPVWQGAKQQALLQQLQQLQQQQLQQQQVQQQRAAAAQTEPGSASQVVPQQPAAAGPSAEAAAAVSSAAADAQLPHSATPRQALAAPQAAPAAVAAAAAAAAADASGMWLSWLDSFYAASLPLLQAYSPQDLIVTACTLASQQQVPPVPWYGQLLAAIAGKGGQLSASHVAGLAWALGRLALLPCRHNPGVSLVPLQPWLAGLYARSGLAAAGTGTATSTELAASAAEAVEAEGAAAAAVAAVGWESAARGVPEAQGLRVSRGAVRPAEDAVRLMWAAAVCDFDPGDAWWGAAEQLLLAPAGRCGLQQAQYLSKMTMHQAQQQLQQSLVSRLPTRLLGALLQAYAASGRPVPEGIMADVLSSGVLEQLCRQPLIDTLRMLRSLAQASSSNSSSSHGRSGGGSHALQEWLQQLALGLQGRLALLTPQELGQLLLWLADAGLTLQQHATSHPAGADATTCSSDSSSRSSTSLYSWAAAVAEACEVRLRQMSPTDISRLLLSTVKLQLQLPPALTQALLQQMQAGFLDATPVALANAVDAISRMAVVPSRDWLGGFYMATHRSFTAASAAAAASSSSGPGQALAAAILQTLQGLARIKAAPPAKWLKQQLVLLHGQLAVLQPRHIATLLLLLARLKCRPSPAYLHRMLQHLGDCSACRALDLVHIAYGMASLHWQPSRQWMQLLMAATARKLPLMSNQGLALVHWALAGFRMTPPLLWRRIALQVVAARLPQLDALQMSMIVWAWGRLEVHLVPLQPPVEGAAGRRAVCTAVQQLRYGQQPQQQPQQQAEAAAVGGAAGSGSLSSTGVVPADTSSSMGDAGSNDPQRRLSTAWQLQQRVAGQLLEAVLGLQGQYNASQLAHLLAGIAKMQLRPSQAWLHALVTKGSRQQPSVLDGYQLQQLLWALALLRYRAAPAWVEGMGVLLETRWQRAASTRHSAAWALQELRQLAAEGAVVESAVGVPVGWA